MPISKPLKFSSSDWGGKFYPLDISEFAPRQRYISVLSSAEADGIGWLEEMGKSISYRKEAGAVKGVLDRFKSALESIANSTCCGGCQEAARVAQSALHPPVTKEVEVWRLEWSVKDLTGNWAPVAAHYPTKEAADDQARRLSRMAGEGAPHCIKGTGPHKQLVPAD